MNILKLINVIIWVALTIGAGEILVSFTNEMRGAAVKAHLRGLISHRQFTKQLAGQ